MGRKKGENNSFAYHHFKSDNFNFEVGTTLKKRPVSFYISGDITIKGSSDYTSLFEFKTRFLKWMSNWLKNQSTFLLKTICLCDVGKERSMQLNTVPQSRHITFEMWFFQKEFVYTDWDKVGEFSHGMCEEIESYVRKELTNLGYKLALDARYGKVRKPTKPEVATGT